MKLKIKYATKERKSLGPHSYQNVCKEVELEPVRILRNPCGRRGSAVDRYYYQADFTAPNDAEFVRDGLIRANIDRKSNPQFVPKKMEFHGNICSA